jgi:hypothetical protein
VESPSIVSARGRRIPAFVGTAVGIAVAAIYWLRLDSAVGLVVDDAWYVLLAGTLADGSGYRIVSSAASQILPVYPPAFPALLSVVFRIAPEFPGNVWMLKSVSVAAMLAAGLLTYRYFARHRQIPRGMALFIAVSTAVTPAFVFLATSTVMSECVFTLFQLATVMLVERAAGATRDGSRVRYALAGGAAAAMVVLTRTAGVTVCLAAVLYLAKARLWRAAAVHAAVTAACVAPWLLYARTHAPSEVERREHGGAVAQAYGDQFWGRRAGVAAAGEVTISDLPGRVVNNVWNVLSRDIGGIFVPALFRGPEESGQEVLSLGPADEIFPAGMGNTRGTVVSSSALGVVVMLGFARVARRRMTMAEWLVICSLAVTVLWPFWTFRFVLPLTPFLYFFLYEGSRALTVLAGRLARPRAARDSWRASRIAAVSIIGLNLMDHAGYIVRARMSSGDHEVAFHSESREVETVLTWMQDNLTGEGDVAADNPALVYLRTGRRGVVSEDFMGNWERWRAMGIRYVVSLRSATLPPRSLGFQVRFRSPRRGYWVVQI